MTGLGELFGREITDTLASLYWRLLADWTDDQFEAAFQAAANRLKFFPKPVELRELLGGDQETLALEAWETLYRTIKRVGHWQSVLFPDSRITRAVESLGGWDAVCCWETKDLSYNRNNFIKLYLAFKDGGPPRVMAGYIERSNSGNPPEPVVIGAERPTPPPRLVGA